MKISIPCCIGYTTISVAKKIKHIDTVTKVSLRAFVFNPGGAQLKSHGGPEIFCCPVQGPKLTCSYIFKVCF